jgi:hypothetical protein
MLAFKLVHTVQTSLVLCYTLFFPITSLQGCLLRTLCSTVYDTEIVVESQCSSTLLHDFEQVWDLNRIVKINSMI